MSKVSRKTAVSEEKEKGDSPIKEMKKKMAANAEKEKQATEKPADKPTDKTADKAEKTDKNVADKKSDKTADKITEKNIADKKNDKNDKNVADKKSDKNTDKITEKSEKQDKNVAEKKNEKVADKNEKKAEPQAEKSKEDGNKEDKNAKSEKSEQKKPDSKPKQNGREPRVHNGISDVTLNANGSADEPINGTVSESEDDDVQLVIDDHDQDELFPELAYDDSSDVECFEPPTPEGAPSRSFTRRSQVKAARTPETPRPASDKQTDKEADEPKDSKVLKLKEDAPPTDRKLRSADSPKPEGRKTEAKKDESPKKQPDGEDNEAEKSEKNEGVGENGEVEKVQMEVIVEVESSEGESRKPDTNFSKSRVKVSPYRRSMRIADQTNSSLLANYTGNNTTMEMDITESSIAEEALDDSSYLRGLRTIKGRNSYKQLGEVTLRHTLANRSARSTASLNTSESQPSSRPTGTVVGRKRKPDSDEVEVAEEASGLTSIASTTSVASGVGSGPTHGKRMRLLERLAVPFRRLPATRNAEIVGINTDLPLTAPVASTESFDPESLKSQLPAVAPEAPIAVPLAPLTPTEERDGKRCAIM